MSEPTHEPTPTTTPPEQIDWTRLAPPEHEPSEPVHGEREYQPIHPGGGLRDLLRKLWAPIAALLGLAVKFGFIFAKFAALFVSIGGYALLWGWQFAVGFVVLILIHELGHFVEARRQGFHASLPMFIPFLGAYVTIRGAFNPWKNGLVSIAGPIAGGVASVVTLGLGEAMDSNLLRALAYFGFLLNLFNLLPVGFLDGGAIWRSTNWLWRGGGRSKGAAMGIAYAGVALLLALGMWAAHVPQHRL